MNSYKDLVAAAEMLIRLVDRLNDDKGKCPGCGRVDEQCAPGCEYSEAVVVVAQARSRPKRKRGWTSRAFERTEND